MDLFLKENIYQSISDNALTVYCVIKALSNERIILNEDFGGKIFVTVDSILYYLTGTTKHLRRFRDAISNGLDELLNENYIISVEGSKKFHLLDCSYLNVDTEKEYFTSITREELRKIFQIEGFNHFWLLRYFVYLIGTINSGIDVWLDAVQHKSRVVGNLSIDYLSDITGISSQAIYRYNRVLEENNLLYIYRPDDFTVDEKGRIARFPNIYGRPCDKEYIDIFAQNQNKYKKGFKYRKVSEKTNNKRRLAQMYIQLCSGNGEKYSKEDIIEIYQYALAENKKYEVMAKDDSDFLDKIRDLRIFDKYDFIETEWEK